MYLLITYDVDTTTAAGRKRLRQVAKCCQNHGQRVQNSVFECSLSPADFVGLRNMLIQIINNSTDSIRIYHLGKNYSSKIEFYGIKTSFDFNGELIV